MWSLVLVLWHTKDESFWENHSNFQIQCRLYCEIFVRVVASSFTGICINPAFCSVSLLWLQKNLLIPRGKRVCGVKSWRKGMALQGGYFSRNDLCQCHSFDLVVCFFLAALPALLPVRRTVICLCMGHWAPELVLLLLTLIYHHKCL